MKREDKWCAAFLLVKNSWKKFYLTPILYPSSKNTDSAQAPQSWEFSCKKIPLKAKTCFDAKIWYRSYFFISYRFFSFRLSKKSTKVYGGKISNHGDAEHLRNVQTWSNLSPRRVQSGKHTLFCQHYKAGGEILFVEGEKYTSKSLHQYILIRSTCYRIENYLWRWGPWYAVSRRREGYPLCPATQS